MNNDWGLEEDTIKNLSLNLLSTRLFRVYLLLLQLILNITVIIYKNKCIKVIKTKI